MKNKKQRHLISYLYDIKNSKYKIVIGISAIMREKNIISFKIKIYACDHKFNDQKTIIMIDQLDGSIIVNTGQNTQDNS